MQPSVPSWEGPVLSPGLFLRRERGLYVTLLVVYAHTIQIYYNTLPESLFGWPFLPLEHPQSLLPATQISAWHGLSHSDPGWLSFVALSLTLPTMRYISFKLVVFAFLNVSSKLGAIASHCNMTNSLPSTNGGADAILGTESTVRNLVPSQPPAWLIYTAC